MKTLGVTTERGDPKAMELLIEALEKAQGASQTGREIRLDRNQWNWQTGKSKGKGKGKGKGPPLG